MASRRLQLKKQLLEKTLIANVQERDAVARIEKEIEEEEEEEVVVVVVVVVVAAAVAVPAVATKALEHLSVFIETNRDRAIKPESFANGIGGGAL
jgi:hypothetical protein